MRTKNLALALSAGLVVGMLATASFANADQKGREERIVTNYSEHHPRAPGVPELDSGIVIPALAMLSGAAILLTDQFLRREEEEDHRDDPPTSV